MLGKLISLFKKTEQKPIEDIIKEFKTDYKIKFEPQKNVTWNKFAEVYVDYLFKNEEGIHLLILDPKKANQNSDYITTNPEYYGQDIYLYTIDKENNFSLVKKHEKIKIKIKKEEEKKIDIKLDDVIKKINPDLREIVQKYFKEGKKNNPVAKTSNDLNEFLLHRLYKEFNSEVGILYKGMPRREEKKLIGTEEDLIIFNSLSGRDDFIKGIPHFSSVFGRASFKDGYHYIKSGIVLNLITGEYYSAKDKEGTYLINEERKKQIVPKPNHHFQKTTIRAKIFKKHTEISDEYKKEKKEFFKYINYLESIENSNIKTMKELSFGLSIMEDIENTSIIAASHFPVYNAGIAFLLQGLGFVRLNTSLDQIKLNDLNEKPMMYFQNNSLMQDFTRTIKKEEENKLLNKLYYRK